MSRIAAIGTELELAGYALAGVELQDADGPEAVQRAWAALASDVGLVLLTPAAAAVVVPDQTVRTGLLCVVLPG